MDSFCPLPWIFASAPRNSSPALVHGALCDSSEAACHLVIADSSSKLSIRRIRRSVQHGVAIGKLMDLRSLLVRLLKFAFRLIA